MYLQIGGDISGEQTWFLVYNLLVNRKVQLGEVVSMKETKGRIALTLYLAAFLIFGWSIYRYIELKNLGRLTLTTMSVKNGPLLTNIDTLEHIPVDLNDMGTVSISDGCNSARYKLLLIGPLGLVAPGTWTDKACVRMGLSLEEAPKHDIVDSLLEHSFRMIYSIRRHGDDLEIAANDVRLRYMAE
jgi:hypothetical protein